jgi:hypothetical protein
MTRAVSLGYLTPSRNCFELSELRVIADGHEPLANPDTIPHWHYATDLVVERNIAADVDAIRRAARLDPGDQVLGVLVWTSTSTGLQGSSPPVVLGPGPNELRVSIPGREIGGTLKLRTVVSAGVSSADGRDPLAAHRPGSTLWSDEFNVILEGDSSRFPTEALSFSATGVGSPICAWRLDIDTSDLYAPALSAVRVVLNTDHPAYERLAGPSGNPEADVTRQFLAYDIARQIVVTALAREDLTATDYDRGSIGDVLRARLRDYFGQEGDDVQPLRQRWASSPSEIDAELQAFFPL